MTNEKVQMNELRDWIDEQLKIENERLEKDDDEETKEKIGIKVDIEKKKKPVE